jgi:hypothetical protein
MLETLKLVRLPIRLAVKPHLAKLGDPLLFVDGPNHDDQENALTPHFDYFCSSGGHPQQRMEERRTFLFWILEGWSRDEMIDALTRIHATTNDVANEIYKICGGKIREAVSSIQDQGHQAALDLEVAISKLGATELSVNFHSTDRSGVNKDRLRTMLLTETREGIDDAANVEYVVDSEYALKLLLEKMSTAEFLKGYRLTKKMGANSVAGSYFEVFWHRLFQTREPGGISVVQSNETKANCISQLTEKNQYWIPSAGFPDIDAAIIRDDTLYALQYTVSARHDLNTTSIPSFVSKVLENISFEGVQYVKILYMVPLGSTGLTVTPKENVTDASGTESQSKGKTWKVGQPTPSTLPPTYSIGVFEAEPNEYTAIPIPEFPFLTGNPTEIPAQEPDFKTMTVAQLKKVLRIRGLPYYGKKADLVKRLQK